MNKIKKILTALFSVVVVLIIIGFACEITPQGDAMPDNALYFVNTETHQYFHPLCLVGPNAADKDYMENYAIEHNLKVVEIRNIDKSEFKYQICQGSARTSISLNRQILIWAGILPDVESRWNSNGTWRF